MISITAWTDSHGRTWSLRKVHVALDRWTPVRTNSRRYIANFYDIPSLITVAPAVAFHYQIADYVLSLSNRPTCNLLSLSGCVAFISGHEDGSDHIAQFIDDFYILLLYCLMIVFCVF